MDATHTATHTAMNRRSVAGQPLRLSHRGAGAVAVVAAGLVVLASAGHTVPAAVIAYALYALVSGRVAGVAAKVRRSLHSPRIMRGLGWAAAAAAAYMAATGATAAGGPVAGFALAAALATYLKATGRGGR